MRIREEPLKAITELDVISKTPFDAKKGNQRYSGPYYAGLSVDPKSPRKIEKYL
jgi:hypothetical protein